MQMVCDKMSPSLQTIAFGFTSVSNYCPLRFNRVYKMSLKIYVNDSEEDTEEEDDIKRKLVDNPSPIPDEDDTRQYATMADIEREGDIVSEGGGNLALYEDELRQKPRISQLLSKLVIYEPVPNNPNQLSTTSNKKNGKKKVKMGTIMGVYLPTLQNILGVILFLRLTWIVGNAGVVQSLIIILLCCCCTMLTAISMSAIATNGVVPAGGAYFMISRNLGPEFGGAVGVLFYLGTSFAVSLYVLGAIELLLKYIAPQMSLFGDVMGNPSVLYNNMRVYGTILLLLLSIIVFVGVRYVNYFATCALVCVLVAVVSIYAGILSSQTHLCVCTLDGVALKGASDDFQCPKIKEGICHTPLADFTQSINTTCSPDNQVLLEAFRGTRFVYENESLEWTTEPECSIGIPGLSRTSTIIDNAQSNYLEEGDVEPGVEGEGVQLSAQVTSSFFILISIFFPSVTGIMAGSNRSGDLKDAQKSIPIGTIAAILTTSLIYLTCVLFFGGSVAGFALRDQFGDAIGGLVVAELAWPTRWLILIGALLSTVGAGLQSLTGAPRLLQAIARDNLIPFLKVFGYSSTQGEPTYALIFTVVMSELGVLIASVDSVAPILSMFFLMCYMFVNVACALQSLLQAPNWRPRFKCYHWTLSTAGAILCIVMMFISSWFFALITLVIAMVIYQYIAYRGAEKEWGDGMRGLSLQVARYSLLQLEEGPLHTKNWRPQLLVLCKLHPTDLTPSQPKLLSFATQLKAGKGLTMVTSIVEGNYVNKVAEVKAAKETLKRVCDKYKIQGFCKVIAVPDITVGLSQIIQGSGLGGLIPNTVLLAWPDAWRKKHSWKTFIETVRVVMATEKALIVTKGINWFPSNGDKCRGNIDIWWVVHDGGLLMLLPFLLRQHKVWRQCHLRIFTVAQMEDDSIQMKKDLKTFIYQLRIDAEVHVIEMPDCDISGYTFERTVLMEERNKILTRLRMNASTRHHYHDNHRYHNSIQHLITSQSNSEEGSHDLLPETTSTDTSKLFTMATSSDHPTSQLSIHEENVRRMNTSVKLNDLIVSRSHDARLVLLNLPGPPTYLEYQENYMEFLDVLTEGLERVLLVRGGGREVITIYS